MYEDLHGRILKKKKKKKKREGRAGWMKLAIEGGKEGGSLFRVTTVSCLLHKYLLCSKVTCVS